MQTEEANQDPHSKRDPYDALKKRQLDALRVGQFGVQYLDDALNGIRPCDLIVIGARTGAGKSELAASIATSAALNDKPVSLFALESERFEIKNRLTYQILAEHFFANRGSFPAHISLNFTDWLFDKYDNQLEAIEYLAADEFDKKYSLLEILSPTTTEFTKGDFTQMYEDAVSRGVEMVILDHIHYLAADDREGEYEHTKRTMWRLRDLINKHEVPVIALSHLRKEDRRNDSLIPTIEELHGSSEISKQANHVISLAPIFSLPTRGNNAQKFDATPGTTGIRVLKTRTGHHGSTHYVGVMKFNFETNRYDDKYVPYRTDKWASELRTVEYQDFERWMGMAREARN